MQVTVRQIKLHNRRVMVGWCPDRGDWFLKFKNLVSREGRDIKITELFLSTEAVVAVISLFSKLHKDYDWSLDNSLNIIQEFGGE